MKTKLKIKQTKSNMFFVIIGRLLTYGTIYIATIFFILWAFGQITVYK